MLAPSRHLSPFCAFISKLPFPLCDPYWSYPLPSPLFLPSCLTRASPVTFSLATDRSRFWSPLSLPLSCPAPIPDCLHFDHRQVKVGAPYPCSACQFASLQINKRCTERPSHGPRLTIRTMTFSWKMKWKCCQAPPWFALFRLNPATP